MDRLFHLTFWPVRIDHRLLDLLRVLPGVVAGLDLALERKGVVMLAAVLWVIVEWAGNRRRVE